MGKEKLHEVSKGHVGAWAGQGDGEGIAEVSREVVDECSRKFMWGEVRFEVSGEDLYNLGNDVELDAEEFYREVVRKARRIAKGGTKAITGIDDCPIGPKEGDEVCTDVVKGGWICSRRRGYVALRGCHDGIGGVEGNTGVALEEDIFFPQEGEHVSG